MNCPRSCSSFYTNISLQTCVKRLLKQTAPASGVGAETEAWGAFTAGLISEAHDTVEALATVAAVSPAVPRPL